MSFIIEHENSQGKVAVKLNKEVSVLEMRRICSIIDEILSKEEFTYSKPTTEDFPIQKRSDKFVSSGFGSINDVPVGQKNLGQFPIPMIDMGSYDEPANGVRIKMVEMIKYGRIPAIRAIRAATGISMKGCCAILYGNYPCPILTMEAAKSILEEFKKMNLHARIIPAFDE